MQQNEAPEIHSLHTHPGTHPSRLSSTVATGAGEAGPEISALKSSPPCSLALPLQSTAAARHVDARQSTLGTHISS